MSKRDQLEIIDASGQITFHDLNPAKGITNIGRHPDNDVVIDSPDVALFHAMLDHRQKPYQLIVLSQQGTTAVAGQSLPPNVSRELHNWDMIELNGHSLILLEDVTVVEHAPPPATTPAAPVKPVLPVVPTAAAPAAAPAPKPAAVAVAAALPDRTDDYILTEISGREFTIDVEQKAVCQLTIINGGDIVATFNVDVRGVPYHWVTIAPPQVNLFEGERATVSITLVPPRQPSSRAGAHRFSVVVTSPNHPGRSSVISGTLFINPYYEYEVGELSPKQQTIRWRKQTGQALLDVTHKGNSDTTYRLDAMDDERGCRFEFQIPGEAVGLTRQVEMRLPPDETRPVTVLITPLKRRLVGMRGHLYSYTVTASPLAGTLTPRSAFGQVTSTPLIGAWMVVLAVVLLAALLAYIFRPTITSFTADPAFIKAGETTTLRWHASPVANLRIDPDIGPVPGPDGSKTLSPRDTVTYKLTAENLLSRLMPAWFIATKEVQVFVGPVLPTVQFTSDKVNLVTGESATLSWQVTAAEEVILTTNGVPETIPTSQYKGSRVVKPDSGETVYTLLARNRYTTQGVTANVTLKVTAPTPTPLPLPVIQRFDAQPSVITAGDKVTLQWSVTNAEKVSITPLGTDFPPNGVLVVSPSETTAYVLTVSNGQREVTSLQQVTVHPAPTPTPVPGVPKIDFFTVTPADVILGSSVGGSIALAWSVTGDTTDIQITSPDFGQFTGLLKQGSMSLTVDKSSQFVLTAYNGTLSASQTVQVNASVPVPSIAGFSPLTATVGGPGFTLTVSGANFVSSSVARWNGVDRPTTFVSPTALQVQISASDIAATGSFPITVFNPAPGGGASAPVNFSVVNPTPTLTNILPQTTTVGATNVTLQLTGANYVANSVVRFKGADRATTFVSNTQLNVLLLDADMTNAGDFPITVFNPAPVGGISSPLDFTVQYPPPTITSLNPTSVSLGDPPTALTIVGTNFTNTTAVAWNGIGISPVTYNGPTQLTVTFSNTAAAGSGPLIALNPGPGGGASNLVTFTVNKITIPINLTVPPPPLYYGVPALITATVASTVTTPTGDVTFIKDGAPQTTVPLSGGQATFSTQDLPVNFSNYNFQASYSGDANFLPGTSATSGIYINPVPTVLTIMTSPSSSTYGEPVTITVQVGTSPTSLYTPTGNVYLYDYNGSYYRYLASATLNAGSATVTTTDLRAANPDTIYVNYYPDTYNFGYFFGQTYPQTVNQASTSTTITSAGPNAVVTVSNTSGVPGGPVPTGYVDYYYEYPLCIFCGRIYAGRSSLVNGQADFYIGVVPSEACAYYYDPDGNFVASLASYSSPFPPC